MENTPTKCSNENCSNPVPPGREKVATPLCKKCFTASVKVANERKVVPPPTVQPKPNTNLDSKLEALERRKRITLLEIAISKDETLSKLSKEELAHACFGLARELAPKPK
jgi:hypothetical protein